MQVLAVDGRVVTVNGKAIEAPQTGDVAPQIKNVTITENGKSTVTPDENKYLSRVGITVAVPSDKKPEQIKDITLVSNGTTAVEPDDGNVFSKVNVTVAVPSDAKEEETKSVTLTKNGTTTLSPASGKVFSKVDVTVAVPSDAKPEQTKSVELTENGTTNVTPDSGKTLSGVDITVNVPSDQKPEQTKTVAITSNGTHTVAPDDGKVLIGVTMNVNVPSDAKAGQTKSISLTENGVSGSVTPDAGYTLDRVNYSVTIPEQTKSVSVTTNGSTVVLPDSGKLMNKVTVNVNVPTSGSGGVAPAIQGFMFLASNPPVLIGNTSPVSYIVWDAEPVEAHQVDIESSSASAAEQYELYGAFAIPDFAQYVKSNGASFDIEQTSYSFSSTEHKPLLLIALLGEHGTYSVIFINPFQSNIGNYSFDAASAMSDGNKYTIEVSSPSATSTTVTLTPSVVSGDDTERLGVKYWIDEDTGEMDMEAATEGYYLFVPTHSYGE